MKKTRSLYLVEVRNRMVSVPCEKMGPSDGCQEAFDAKAAAEIDGLGSTRVSRLFLLASCIRQRVNELNDVSKSTRAGGRGPGLAETKGKLRMTD